MKKSKKKVTYTGHTRYDLSRTYDKPPRGEQMAWAFMLSTRWLQRFPDRAADVGSWVHDANPDWYAPNPEISDSSEGEGGGKSGEQDEQDDESEEDKDEEDEEDEQDEGSPASAAS